MALSQLTFKWTASLAAITLLFSLQFCKQNMKMATYFSNSYYYYGQDKITVSIPGDTLGFLLSADLVLHDSLIGISTPQGQKRRAIDSILLLEGFRNAGYLPANVGNIILATSTKKSLSVIELEKEAKRIRKKYPQTFFDAGYLARIQVSKAPIIITDEVNITFKPNTNDSLRNDLFNRYHLDTIGRDPYTPGKFLVTPSVNSAVSALDQSHELHNDSLLLWANINLIYIKEFQSTKPTDPYYGQQWALNNPGPNTATNNEDADIDADMAWDFTKGSGEVTVAVLDDGFELSHEDLSNNFRHDGWNFIDDNSVMLSSSYPSAHGTAVSGIIAAEQNSNGITGIAPDCLVLPLRTAVGSSGTSDSRAFGRAIAFGAKVINCSWELLVPIPDLLQSVNDAEAGNVLVVCSMNNYSSMDPGASCSSFSLCSMPTTFSVSRSNSLDNSDGAGFGDCLDLLAPSSSLTTSLQMVTTTDLMGRNGYNKIEYDELNCPPIDVNGNYTGCFWGTSASAPLTAGVAALIYSADPQISAAQLRDLLKDCADKIQPSTANYSPLNGKSVTETHGFGRLNAYEAVKIASRDISKGGKSGVDIFIRDNNLDWGNTERPSSFKFETNDHFQAHWVSPDIKIDAPDLSNPSDPFEPVVDDQAKFEALTDQSPVGNAVNRVYVRVRNRGYKPAGRVTVKLYWVYGGLALPALWPGFPADAPSDPTWHYIGTRNISDLRHSGASVAGTISDAAQIVSFDLTAPDPALNPVNHYCLLAMIDSPDDPLPPELSRYSSLDDVTPNFNNVTHRNITILPSGTTSKIELYMNNPDLSTIQATVHINNPSKLPIQVSNIIVDSAMVLQPRERRKIIISIVERDPKKHGEIELVQEYKIGKRKVNGGNTLRF